jgi:transcriptional regulator with XRE-family HTH domain
MTPEELRWLRQNLGWSQAAAAARLGIGLRTYKYYEAGQTADGDPLPDDRIPKLIATAALAYRLAHDLMVENLPEDLEPEPDTEDDTEPEPEPNTEPRPEPRQPSE